MGTYNIPRNVKGEGRLLFIFSTKALIYSGIGAIAGGIFYIIFSLFNLKFVGIIFVVLFAIIGFSIATFKMPKISKFEITDKTGGEDIDDIIKRAVKFKMKKNKYYVYTKEDKIDE